MSSPLRCASAIRSRNGPGSRWSRRYTDGRHTDSPHWKEYIETRWLPRCGDRAIAFDRSRPWREDQVEARLWRAVAGPMEHTPVVIVVPPRGKVQIVRFWLAFRDYKHGKERRLRDAEARLATILGDDSA